MSISVAIVGMACRVPGADSPEELWELMNGDGAVPSRRLAGVDLFDAEFFGISPREARGMDPQQRLLLEVVHDAFEVAGIPVSSLAGSDTGVYAAQHADDYAILSRDADRTAGRGTDLQSYVGSHCRSFTASRVSFAFDLRGPSATVDAACSSSLVAVHLAVRAIQAGDCRLAVAGGVNLVLRPEVGTTLAGAGVIAEDGRCKFADAGADGMARSEGIAAVLLKPLADARRDGDRVHAVVLGSAVTNDGRSGPYLLTPAVSGQELTLRTALRDAGIDPADVDYVEAHGAGTPVGDRVELTALGRVLGEGRPRGRPCVVGSVKPSVGHTESAAGLVGMIRAVLCLQRRTVPPNPHLRESHELLGSDSPLSMSRDAVPLPERGRPAVAGVSSFGLSGTNAHIVLAAADPVDERRPLPGQEVLLVGSARDDVRLDAVAEAYRNRLTSPECPALVDMAYSAARRDQHEHRFAVVAATATDAVARLDDLRGRLQSRSVQRARGPVTAAPSVAFAFSGQTAGWSGAGRELLVADDAFAAEFLRCDEAVRTEAGWSLLEHLLTADPDDPTPPATGQPLLWSLQVALAATWRSWGVEPDVVIGHSAGEVAAAQVAGALSMGDAAALVCRRGSLIERLHGTGRMAHVALPEDEARETIARYDGAVVVAAVNGPGSTVLSGEPGAMTELHQRLGPDTASWIAVDYASHSPLVEPIMGELRGRLADIAPRPGTIPIHSTVLDGRIDGSGMTAEYWAANLELPVRFADAVRAQLELGDAAFVEVGPHPALAGAITGLIGEAPDRARSVAVGSLRRGEPERGALLRSLARLHTAGVAVTPLAAAGPRVGRQATLPVSPWRRSSYWVDEAIPARAEPTGVPAQRPALSAVPSRPGSATTSRPAFGTGAADSAPGQVRIRASHGWRALPGGPVASSERDMTAFRGTGALAAAATLERPAVPTTPHLAVAPHPVAPSASSIEVGVRELVAEVLGFAADELSPRQVLLRSGLNSLTATQLRRGILRAYGLDVPLHHLLVSGASIADIAAAVHALATAPPDRPVSP